MKLENNRRNRRENRPLKNSNNREEEEDKEEDKEQALTRDRETKVCVLLGFGLNFDLIFELKDKTMIMEIMEKRAETVQKEREPKKHPKRALLKGERKIRQYRRNRLLLRQHPLPHPSIDRTIIVTKNTDQSSEA